MILFPGAQFLCAHDLFQSSETDLLVTIPKQPLICLHHDDNSIKDILISVARQIA